MICLGQIFGCNASNCVFSTVQVSCFYSITSAPAAAATVVAATAAINPLCLICLVVSFDIEGH